MICSIVSLLIQVLNTNFIFETNVILQISRLEGQLQRLRQTADTYERNEDEMRAEKRRLMRDVRSLLMSCNISCVKRESLGEFACRQ